MTQAFTSNQPASVALELAFKLVTTHSLSMDENITEIDRMRRQARLIGVIAGDMIAGMRERLDQSQTGEGFFKDPGEGGIGCLPGNCYTGGCTSRPTHNK